MLLNLVQETPVADVKIDCRSSSIPTGCRQRILEHLDLCLIFDLTDRVFHPGGIRRLFLRNVFRRERVCPIYLGLSFCSQIVVGCFLVPKNKGSNHKIAQFA